MELILSVALLGAAFIVGTIIFLGSRMPVTPVWAHDTLVANFWCVLVIGMVAFGIGVLVQYAIYWEERTLTVRDLAIVGAILVGYALLWSALGVRKRLARYAQQRQASAASVHPIGGGTAATPPRSPDGRVPPKAA